jgi:hypothetical protein
MYKIDYYPEPSNIHGFWTVTAEDFDPSKPFEVSLFFPGIGESGDGSLAALKKASAWGGFKAFYSTVEGQKKQLVYLFMQSIANDTPYNNKKDGVTEIEYAVIMASGLYPKRDNERLHVITISLGGRGIKLCAERSPGNFATFDKIVNIMPGGDFASDNAYAAAAIKYGVSSWWFVSQHDRVTPPVLCSRPHDAIVKGGGDSVNVLYKNAPKDANGNYLDKGHRITSYVSEAIVRLPANLDPNSTFCSLTSPVPSLTVYQWFCDTAPSADKLISKQTFVCEVWQRADGSIYQKIEQ